MNEKTKMEEAKKELIANTYVPLISLAVFILYLSMHLSVFIYKLPNIYLTMIFIRFSAGIALFLCIVSLIFSVFAIKDKWYITCSIIMIIITSLRVVLLF